MDKKPIQTIRDTWTQADPLLVLLATLEQQLLEKHDSIKLIGSREKEKIMGALAMIRTIAGAIIEHRIVGDLIPIVLIDKGGPDVKTATEALELSQKQTREIQEKHMGSDTRPNSEEGGI